MRSQEPVVTPIGDGGFLRIRMSLAYDGGPFRGWAVQPGLRTVQGVLEEALELIARRPVRLTVAGRTDAGVHARGQVVHWDSTPDEWAKLGRGSAADAPSVLQRRLSGALARVLGDDGGAVVVRDVQVAAEGFDARFSALWRRYSYRIADDARLHDPLGRSLTLWHKKPLDVEAMNRGAALLLGLNDFRSYCKPREGATTVRELQRFDFDRGADGIITAHVQADAFCHNMVRALIGATLRVGEGMEPPPWLWERLLEKQRDARSVLAPAHPLVFEYVAYPDDAQLRARAEQTRALRD
ncbi:MULTISPECIES: tRNA pseudouridine(38-40) synthase TruA [Arthrobacter]|uniref:tRNA pseudouridine synthase A n=2 Tax=Arthrobacter TaxID=1663 RepID=A0ABU9KMR8_9MICC|nr:tRNA pseudouridine(38-40) synthase TruA [Arthrobacter sp. YJM1]MDP5228044.1 tRNA pseudouridine(38-40) synthase TruA [Arthrobacter sp. YJM1]